jgi:hypothetical protein
MPTDLDALRFDIAVDPREDRDDGAFEAFDRIAFAHKALDLVRPRLMDIAVCGRSSRLRVQVGRAWGRPEGERWAIVAVPERASRRAIALAIADLAGTDVRPYVLDVLLDCIAPTS